MTGPGSVPNVATSARTARKTTSHMNQAISRLVAAVTSVARARVGVGHRTRGQEASHGEVAVVTPGVANDQTAEESGDGDQSAAGDEALDQFV